MTVMDFETLFQLTFEIAEDHLSPAVRQRFYNAWLEQLDDAPLTLQEWIFVKSLCEASTQLTRAYAKLEHE